MKHKILNKSGKLLMKLNPLKICIIDDEDIYFNKNMIDIANNTGFTHIDRYNKIDASLFKKLQTNPYNILILDIKGITEPDVAKDGLHVATTLHRTTDSYIVMTSAHQYHLNNKLTSVDYIIEDRLLTATDFVDYLIEIVNDCLTKKVSFYKNIGFKIGFALMKKGITQ